jgi:hypothetical protein
VKITHYTVNISIIVYSVHLTGFILEGVGGGDEYIN